MSRQFPLTPDGCEAAMGYLKQIGEYDRVAVRGEGMFSTDGWSVTEEANRLYRKRETPNGHQARTD
mgnify:CR=1 FL=1|jgi:hypothetical protein